MTGFVARYIGAATLLLCILIGLWLRLNQFVDQVLLDDEWHALHQLLDHTPSHIALSFGLADYSIPLTLFYWLESHIVSLDEWALRWPMLAAGIASLWLLPRWVAGHYGWRVAILFAMLLALSPLLVSYSRYARPYALTLLLGYLAHYLFWRYWESGRRGPAVGYVVSAALAVWLHLITLPFVVAPFLLAGARVVFAENRGDTLVRLFRLGASTALTMALLIAPPLLNDPGALSGKSGSDAPDWDTLVGVMHTWLGTASGASVVFSLVLAALGVGSIWRDQPLVRGLLLGVGLTLALIFITRPAWVHVPLTFGRYLLPAMPLLLLAVALGTMRLASWSAGCFTDRRSAGVVTFLVCLLPILVLTWRSPLGEALRQPNSYTLHAMYQVDYRPRPDDIRTRMASDIPLSPWWAGLRASGRESVRVAVAPFQYFSPKWDGPRWERESKQRVIPGYLVGLCIDRRDGELPLDGRFAPGTAVNLGDAKELRRKRIDYVVYQRPYTVIRAGQATQVGADVAHCYPKLRERFGAPSYEDDKIVVFSLNPGIVPNHAQQ